MVRKITKSATGTIVEGDPAGSEINLNLVKGLIDEAAEMLDREGGDRTAVLAARLRSCSAHVNKLQAEAAV